MSERTRLRLGREERREQIVAAAAECFKGRDPAEVTFEEIADAAGVSRALVYNYFGDRNGLIEAVYRRTNDILRSRIARVLTSTRGLNNALASSVRVHLEYARDDPHGYRFATGEQAFSRLPALGEERLIDLAANFEGGLDAQLVARGMLAALESMVVHWLDYEQHTVSLDHAVEIITGFLRGALGAVDGIGVHLTPRWQAPD